MVFAFCIVRPTNVDRREPFLTGGPRLGSEDGRGVLRLSGMRITGVCGLVVDACSAYPRSGLVADAQAAALKSEFGSRTRTSPSSPS